MMAGTVARKRAGLATLKAELECEMSGDWVKLSGERDFKGVLGSPDSPGDEMCLLLIALSSFSFLRPAPAPLSRHPCRCGNERSRSARSCAANHTSHRT